MTLQTGTLLGRLMSPMRDTFRVGRVKRIGELKRVSFELIWRISNASTTQARLLSITQQPNHKVSKDEELLPQSL